MLSTGDVKNWLRKLEGLLRVIKYSGNVDYELLSKGDPSSFLPIMNFILTSFSPPFTEQLIATGLELSCKTDLRFTDTLYKVLRDVFNYKPVLSKQQFLLTGFSQRKLSFLCDLINMVLQKHKQLSKSKAKFPASNKDLGVAAHQFQTEPDNVSKRKNEFSFPANPPLPEASIFQCEPYAGYEKFYSDDFPRPEIKHLSREETKEGNVWSVDEDRRLSDLETQIQSLQFKMGQMNNLDKRIEELERRTNSIKNGEQVVLSRECWENLISRVLLLETKLELNSSPVDSLPTTSVPSTTSVTPDFATESLTNQLEKITSMLKSTSDLLKTTESSDTSMES